MSLTACDPKVWTDGDSFCTLGSCVVDLPCKPLRAHVQARNAFMTTLDNGKVTERSGLAHEEAIEAELFAAELQQLRNPGGIPGRPFDDELIDAQRILPPSLHRRQPGVFTKLPPGRLLGIGHAGLSFPPTESAGDLFV